MRKLFLILGLASFAFGTTILFYDAYFFLHYDADVNDVAAVVNGGIADWPTGERPLYTFFPAWFYGIVFILIAVVLLIIFSKKRAVHETS
jgi:hypothetical protein